MRQLGTVKWYRGDGTGYIVGDDGVTRYVDRSVLADDTDELMAHDRVGFTPKTVLGREVAMEVSLAYDNVCIECGVCLNGGGQTTDDDGLCEHCAG